jgi:hypothetical protein
MAFAQVGPYPQQATTDAEFRTWGSAVSAQLAAVSLIKAADTGQIDWATVARPTAANGVAGYEIWRFNDSLQATKPVFLKLEYGTGISSATSTGMWLTVATGTNGAGTLTGQVGTRYQAAAYNAQTTTSYFYVSGAADRIHLVMWPSAVSYCHGFSVERTKDAAGADDSSGILTSMWKAASTSQAFQEQMIPFTGAIPAVEASPFAFSAPGTTAVVGADVGVFPHFGWYGRIINPRLGLLSYMATDIQALVPITVNMYGAAHTYLPVGVPSNAASIFGRGTGSANSCLLMRYE